MEKLVYEKPTMLIEEFVPTQSVALNCGTNIVDMEPMDLQDGMHICSHSNCGHKIKNVVGQLIKEGKDIDHNGKISLFNTNECELCYEDFIEKNPDNPVLALGNYLVGNNSWNSNEHKMVINGVKIPS